MVECWAKCVTFFFIRLIRIRVRVCAVERLNLLYLLYPSGCSSVFLWGILFLPFRIVPLQVESSTKEEEVVKPLEAKAVMAEKF